MRSQNMAKLAKVLENAHQLPKYTYQGRRVQRLSEFLSETER